MLIGEPSAFLARRRRRGIVELMSRRRPRLRLSPVAALLAGRNAARDAEGRGVVCELTVRDTSLILPGYLIRRLAAAALLLWLVLTTTFVLLHLVPGDAATTISDLPIPKPQREILIHAYGLDRPLPEQYVRWLGAVALHGNLGISYAQLRPVRTVVAEALPATLLLAAAALLIEYGVGTALGVAAARRSGSALDKAIRVATLLLYSQPLFWLGLMAILLFSDRLGWLPASHMFSVGAGEMGR